VQILYVVLFIQRLFQIANKTMKRRKEKVEERNGENKNQPTV